MDKLELAESLIRAPWAKRLTDRTFLSTIGAALTAIGGTIAIWQTQGVPVGDKINTTIAAFVAVGTVVTAWNHGEKSKDKALGLAALQAPELAQPAILGFSALPAGAVREQVDQALTLDIASSLEPEPVHEMEVKASSE